MTESAGAPQDLQSHDTFVEDDDGLPGEAADEIDEIAPRQESDRPAARPREGLPAGFRMRHDAHYVDELTTRAAALSIRQVPVTEIEGDAAAPSPTLDALVDSIKRFGLLQPLLVASSSGRARVVDGARRLHAARLAGLRTVPCIVQDVDEATARQMRAATNLRDEPRPAPAAPAPSLMPRAAWDLATSLDLALAQAALCARRSGGSASDVLQADLGRAARVARATAVLMNTLELHRRELDGAALVGNAARATALARRLAGVSLEISIDDEDFRVPVDAALVTQALAGAMDVMLAMLESARRYHDDSADVPVGANEPLAFTVRCVKTRPAMIIELVQRSVSVDPASIGRFFDDTCELHPGGASAALLLAAAARIIRAHGGRVDVRRDEPVGCTVTFILPQTSSRSADL